jgi:transposase-like protein
MTTRKSNDYKITAVNYYLVEDKTQEEVCKIFKCNSRSLMRWVERYKKDGNVDILAINRYENNIVFINK